MSRSPLACLALLALLAGCSDDGAGVRGGSSSGSGSHAGSGSHGSGSGSGAADCPSPAGGGTNVEVSLREFAVMPSAASASAGRITFVAKNDGEHVHELVIAKGDSPNALPTVSASGTEQGTVDESKLPAGAFVGEIEGVAAGKSCAASFPLTAGKYVLFCNIAEQHDGKVENHYQLGMRTVFTVQ